MRTTNEDQRGSASMNMNKASEHAGGYERRRALHEREPPTRTNEGQQARTRTRGSEHAGGYERQRGLTNESGCCMNEGRCCTNEGWCRGRVSSSLIGGSSPPLLLLLLQPIRYLVKCAATSIDVCRLLPRGCNEVGGGQTRGY